MDYWTKRGFKLTSTGPNTPDRWIAHNGVKACVVEVNFFDEWNKVGEWFSSFDRANREARELASV